MGAGPLNYTVTADVPWVGVSPPTGRSTGETDTLTVIYDTAAVPRGHHTAAISVADATASNSPQTIAVDLEVIAFGDFDSDGDVDQEDFGTQEDLEFPVEGVIRKGCQEFPKHRGGGDIAATEGFLTADEEKGLGDVALAGAGVAARTINPCFRLANSRVASSMICRLSTPF